MLYLIWTFISFFYLFIYTSLSLSLSLQAEQNLKLCSQKLKLLKMSLENRLIEFPHLAEEAKDDTTGDGTGLLTIPRPAQLTGTLTLKILGCEGLVDINYLRISCEIESLSSNSRPSTSSLLSHIMTLPRAHRANSSPQVDLEREMDKESTSPPSYASNTLAWSRPRGGSRYNKAKQSLSKQSSAQDLLEEPVTSETY